MMTFLSFLPIITVAIFFAFLAFLTISHDKDVEKKLNHKRNHHNHKTA